MTVTHKIVSVMDLSAKCACKGIRTCLLCEQNKNGNKSDHEDNLTTYVYCSQCKTRAWSNGLTPHSTHVDSKDSDDYISIDGVYLAENVISDTEEFKLIEEMESHTWNDSQSGRRKQDFGPKVNFKKQKIKVHSFRGLPTLASTIFDKLKLEFNDVLQDFQPVELCNLDYDPSRGASIDPHRDDSWLWGERLVTLNLLSDTFLCLTAPSANQQPLLPSHLSYVKILVPMPRRSLLVLSGIARHVWLHGIRRCDIQERRVAITWRELTDTFRNSQSGSSDEIATGTQLLEIASNKI